MRSDPLPPRPALRAAFALACGVVIGGFAYINAWQNSSGHWRIFAKHRWAMHAMREIERGVEQHQREHAVLPDNLSELKPFLHTSWVDDFDSEDRPLDPWGHPYVYTVSENGYELLSYGRDGKLGGLTLDADLPSRPYRERPGEATLKEFTFELPTGQLRVGCALAGVFTAIAVWILFKKTSGDPLLFRFLAWGMTLLFAFVGASMIASLHVSSRH